MMSVLNILRTRRFHEPIDSDDFYYVLGNRRRRMTLQYLLEHDSSQPVTRRTLVRFLEEQGIKRETANVSLYQTHLPALAEHGMINYNSDRGWVSITERGVIAIMIHSYIQRFLNANR